MTCRNVIAGTLVLALVGSGCAAFSKQDAKTAFDIGLESCGLFFSQKQGISFMDAIETVCKDAQVVAPFVDELLSSQRKAAARLAPHAGATTVYVEQDPLGDGGGHE